MPRLVKRVAKRVLLPLIRPRLTRPEIVADLRSLGVRAGGILLVHSSLSALGYVVGGARTVVAALIEANGPGGTLVLPAHSWEEMEAGCRMFDARHTRGCVGVIPETFRSMPGVVRSVHPTHSVVSLGAEARWLTDGHDRCDTPCGSGTPYAKLLERDGQILFLGTGLESNTAFHTIEALADCPYLLRDDPEEFTIVDGAGKSRRAMFRRHQAGIARRFGAVEGLLVDQGIARRGAVGRAPSILIAGSAFLEFMTRTLREAPAFLLAEGVDAGSAPARIEAEEDCR